MHLQQPGPVSGLIILLMALLTLWLVGLGTALMFGGSKAASQYTRRSISWLRGLIGGFIVGIGSMVAGKKRK